MDIQKPLPYAICCVKFFVSLKRIEVLFTQYRDLCGFSRMLTELTKYSLVRVSPSRVRQQLGFRSSDIKCDELTKCTFREYFAEQHNLLGYCE